MQPRTLLTADDIRAAGFRPEPGAETVDDQVAHVWYPSSRRGERWDIGLGVYGAPNAAAADRYWDGLVAELNGGDVAVEPIAVGERAIHAEGWLYLRQGGRVLWVAVEGPDPVLARWAVERLARAVCPRVTPLPPEPEPYPGIPPAGSAVGAAAEPPGPALGPPAGSGGGSPESAVGSPESALGAPGPPGPPSAGQPPPDARTAGEPPVSPSAGASAAGASAAGGSAGAAGDEPGDPAAGPPARTPGGGLPGGPDPAGRSPTGEPPPASPPDSPPGEGPAGGPVLRPRATAPGRYRRRHLADAALAVVGDALVVTDARGRERRLTLDGTPEAPAAIGLTFDPRQTLGAPVAYLAVVDGNGRLLVRDGEVGVWALDDVRRFAGEAGLGYLEPQMRTHEIDWNRQPIEMEGTPWAFILLVAAAVLGAVALVVVGAPAPVTLGVAATIAALAVLATWRSRVRVTRADPAP